MSSLDHSVDRWGHYYKSLTDAYLFPNEFVTRAFLGSYPNLKMSHEYKGKSACDISCGDGRNLVLLHALGLDLHATEISQDICRITGEKLLSRQPPITVDIRVGHNHALPFKDDSFDYLLSWNACYYMQDEISDIAVHIEQYARVLQPGGYLVACVPGPNCFTLQGAQELGNNLVRISTASKWSMLNGSVLYCFKSFADIEETFGGHFTNFQKATIADDCFGITLEYFVFVCQKR